MQEAQREAKEREEQVIRLYDGSPKFCPDFVKVVCFTSPNEAWFRHIRKRQEHPMLIMPLWDLNELQAAAQEFDLDIRPPSNESIPIYAQFDHPDEADDREVAKRIEHRFKIFGGTARECLSTDIPHTSASKSAKWMMSSTATATSVVWNVFRTSRRRRWLSMFLLTCHRTQATLPCIRSSHHPSTCRGYMSNAWLSRW